jgi:palmitoyltransferase
MDHHCPWINNCVGRDTEKFFILFLLYIPVAGIFIAATSYYMIEAQIPKDSKWKLDRVFSMVTLATDGIAALVISIVLGSFGVHHLVLLRGGLTSFDVANARRLGTAKAEKGPDVKKSVMEEVFGVDRRWWVLALPIAPLRSEPTDSHA